MKSFFIGVFVLFNMLRVNAQYYYTDVLSTKQTNQLYKQLMALDYKRINAVSYDGTNEPSKDFVLEQMIDRNGSKIITKSASAGSAESYFTGYYRNNKIDKTVDSGGNAINTVNYRYDNAGRVLSTSSESRDFDGTFTNTETHTWTYSDNGLPVAMMKVKGQTDTTFVNFIYDDDNVAEEIWTRRNREIEHYYYYYNPKKQLTDVVRFNLKSKMMLPDYIFDYDNAGHVTQMTQTQSRAANYIVWQYAYTENGLKAKETAYNKQKELLGRVEYSYK